MKYCPQCQEQFGNELSFCDADGSALIDGSGSEGIARREVSHNRGQANHISSTPTHVTALIGILIGIVLCMLVYIAFLTPVLNSTEPPAEIRGDASADANAPVLPDQITAAPLPSPSPTAEELPSPQETEASLEPAPATTAETSPKIAASQGPISTGAPQNSEARKVITMKDGSLVEADAAWEDASGVWYRQGSLVSFIERSRVEKLSDLSNRPSTEADKP